MASKRQYRHEDISTPPKGWKVRTKTLPSGHLVRIAFPPGRRRKGSGEVVSILHPLGNNPCQNPCNATPGIIETIKQHLAGLKEKVLGKKRGKPIRNLDHIDQAAELHEAFVGEPAKEVVVVNEHEKVRDDYAQLGWTDQLVFHPPYDHQEVKLKEISELYSNAIDDNENPTRAWQDIADELGIPLLVFDTQGDEIRLTASADGKQLYFIGGRQAAFEKHLKDFKTDRNKDLVDLGDLVSLTYSAKKVQAGDTAPHPYYHVFGEEGGTAPRASYDTINKRFRISGGSYSLREADRGIVN
jgi:hypothetical protein